MFLNLTGHFAYNESLYHYAFFVSTYIGTPINLFTLWVIYRYSTKEMKSYKTQLMLYQICSSALDFGMDTLAKPIFFFSHCAGASFGWLRSYLGFGTYDVFVFMVTYDAFCIHFIHVNIVFYRWQMILPETSVFKLRTKWSLLIGQYSPVVLCCFLMPPALYPAYKDPKVVNKLFEKTYPDDAILTTVEGFYFVDTVTTDVFFYGLSILMFWLLFNVVVGAGTSISCIYTLNSMKAHMSVQTRQMHIRFLRMVFMQTTIPLLFLIFAPIGWVTIIATKIRFEGQQIFVAIIAVAFCLVQGRILNDNDCVGWPNGQYVIGCNSTYIRCKNGLKFEKKCPDGLFFEPDNAECTDRGRVNQCIYNVTERTPAICSGWVDGCYTGGCNPWYHCCHDGIYYQKKCGKDEAFHTEKEMCIYRWCRDYSEERMDK